MAGQPIRRRRINGSTSNGLCVGTTCTTKNTWLGTIRGRAGFAADRILFYGTAGGAFGSIQGGGAAFTDTGSTQFGWTAGAGLEGVLTDNLTARIQYLYVDLGNDTCSQPTSEFGGLLFFCTMHRLPEALY
ncbi:MAG: outer membrane beta-barrel protein [Xanthobacteraceae bacterium]